MESSQELMGELLLRAGLVSDDQLAGALQVQSALGGRLGEILVADLVLSENQLAKALAEQKSLPHVNLATIEIDRSAASLLPLGLARRHGIVPTGFEDGEIVLAMSDPLDIEAIDATEMRTGFKVRPVVAEASQVHYAIDKHLVASNALEELRQVDRKRAAGKPKAEKVRATEVPVIRIVQQIVSEAIATRASDIHIEPTTADVRIRYRVDGVLHDGAPLPKSAQAAVVARIKVLADIDITERRRPLEGRLAMKIKGKPVDIRVTTYPTPYGEGMALRVINAETCFLQLCELGLFPNSLATLERMLTRPHGALLVCGPTGSGKTTTMYSVLGQLNRPERKIFTIEDPIEYGMEGLSQISVNPKIDLSFAAGLRTILRADPDVVMVGEIRDPDTASIAVRAALTGHLVLSSLHTNDAPSALTRLADLEVEPYITASGLIGVVAQRLVRRLCPACRRLAEIDPAKLVLAGLSEEEAAGVRPFEAVGCAECGGTGYRGRVGIFEVMEMDGELVWLHLERAPAKLLRDAALAAGMQTLRRDGLDKVALGITTIDEVMKVVF